MTRKTLLIFLALLLAGMVAGDVLEEARALKSWLDHPYTSSALDEEMNTRLQPYLNPVKGEFETSAQFEQRRTNMENQAQAIRTEYSQKKQDAAAAHESQRAKILSRLQYLLQKTREDAEVIGSLGDYDADKQKFRLITADRNYEIVVPLDKAPQMKDNFSRYKITVTRQMNEALEWDYLEARISGPAGIFSSTDKAPVQSATTYATTLIPPNLSASVSFSEPSGNDMLDAEETATVTITIKNNGEGSAHMVEARFDLGTLSGVSHPGSVYFGEIKPGESVSREVKLVAGMEIQNAQARLKINFSEQNGFPPDDKIISFSTRAIHPPRSSILQISALTTSIRTAKSNPGKRLKFAYVCITADGGKLKT